MPKVLFWGFMLIHLFSQKGFFIFHRFNYIFIILLFYSVEAVRLALVEFQDFRFYLVFDQCR